MELERIDVKNVKELDKRCVVCTFQPTLSLNKEWVMSLVTMVIAQDFEKIAQLEVQDSSFETFVLCADMDCRQTVYDLFENAKLQTMQLERLFLEGYSRKLDCTIRMEFSLSDGKISISSPDDYIVNRFLLGGAQKKRGTRLFNQYVDYLEIISTAYLSGKNRKKIEEMIPELKRMK